MDNQNPEQSEVFEIAPEKEFMAGDVVSAPALPDTPSWPPQGVAPWWHTAVLIAFIVLMTVRGLLRSWAPHEPSSRLGIYGMSAIMDALLVFWVWLGVRLRGVSFRSLIGELSFRPKALFRDIGLACASWFCMMLVIGTLSITWLAVEKVHREGLHPKSAVTASASKNNTPNAEKNTPETKLEADKASLDGLNDGTMHAVAQLAPENRWEVLSWVSLCLLVGFTEELVFRGYLIAQFANWFSGWPRFRITGAIVLASLIFGSAHLYQGGRGIFVITVFGGMLSVLAYRLRSLRVGMMVHAGQDIIAGLALAFLKSQHLL